MTLVGPGRVCGRPAEGLITMAVYGLAAQDREAATACAQHLQALQDQCAADGIAYRVMARAGHATGEHW